MKMHVEYDDFGEYMEAYVDGELCVMEEYGIGRSVELILFEEAGVSNGELREAIPANLNRHELLYNSAVGSLTTRYYRHNCVL